MPDNPSVSDAGLVSPDRVRLVVQGVLRAAQQDGWKDPDLARLSGVCGRTIKSYRVEGKEPSLSNALSLAVVIGPRAVNAVLAIIGYGGAAPLDEEDERAPGQIVASVMKHFSVIATAAADGRFDHLERPGCQAASDQIIAELLPLSSAGEAE